MPTRMYGTKIKHHPDGSVELFPVVEHPKLGWFRIINNAPKHKKTALPKRKLLVEKTYSSWVKGRFAQRVFLILITASVTAAISPLFYMSRTKEYSISRVLKRVLHCPAPDFTAEEHMIFRHYAYMNDWPTKMIGDLECYDPPE